MRDADVVVCLAPLTPRTHRMIGAGELAWLKPDSVFVNVSRGAIVDPDALIERARQGDIRVSLDVFDPEPIPAGSPIRDLPNVHFVHFTSLKRDMPGEMRRIADFIGAAVDPADWPTLIEYCSFDWMKRNATKSVPLGGAFWDGGAETFIHKGVNGRWRDVLTAGDVAEYEARAVRELGPECARWLATGER